MDPLYLVLNESNHFLVRKKIFGNFIIIWCHLAILHMIQIYFNIYIRPFITIFENILQYRKHLLTHIGFSRGSLFDFKMEISSAKIAPMTKCLLFSEPRGIIIYELVNHFTLIAFFF